MEFSKEREIEISPHPTKLMLHDSFKQVRLSLPSQVVV